MSSPQSIYVSKDYWVLNKNPGLHSDEIITHCTSLPPVTSHWELVNRLDFETTGALLFARAELLESTRRLFQSPGTVSKVYLAGASHSVSEDLLGRRLAGHIASRYRSSKKVRFVFEDDQPALRTVRNWHSVRPAQLIVRALTSDPTVGAFTGKLYEVELLTGARHQIRAFFEACSASLIGDTVYGASAPAEGTPAPRLELHAWKLSFKHPETNEEITTEAPVARTVIE